MYSIQLNLLSQTLCACFCVCLRSLHAWEQERKWGFPTAERGFTKILYYDYYILLLLDISTLSHLHLTCVLLYPLSLCDLRLHPEDQNMETSAPTATEKKECKGSGVDGSSFSELPKKPSPSTLTRGRCLHPTFPNLPGIGLGLGLGVRAGG